MSAYENWKVELASTSSPEAAFPVWDVDLTPYVDGVFTVEHGRMSELTTATPAQPAQLALVLNNADHRFTPGNTGSPLYPNFKQGKRLRVRETIGYRTFDLMTGWLELPDITDWAEQGTDQTITVTVVDRLTRLDRGRTFVSTLAEYILDAAGSLLKAYYPFDETSGNTFRDYFSVQPPFVAGRSDGSLGASVSSLPTITPAGGAGPPGDDINGLKLTPVTTPYGNLSNALARAYAVTADYRGTYVASPTWIDLHAGDLLTVVAWFNLDAAYDDTQMLLVFDVRDRAGGGATASTVGLSRNSYINTNPDAGKWTLDVIGTGTGLDTTITTIGAFTGGTSVPVGIQLGFSSNTAKLWVGSDEWTSVPTGTPNDPLSLHGSFSVGALAGSVSHLQVYLGNYTRTMFLAQRTAGGLGLAGQRTDDRVSTIARYAGITSGNLILDRGSSWMQKASLAGQTPLTAMRNAETTEQGLLLADGSGRLVLQNRIRRYNV
jgi:hypothetical protein